MAGNSPIKPSVKAKKEWTGSLLYRTQKAWQKAGLADKKIIEWLLEPVKDAVEQEKYKFGMRCINCIRHKEDPTVKGRGGPSGAGRNGIRIK
jgi:hypothetical protein